MGKVDSVGLSIMNERARAVIFDQKHCTFDIPKKCGLCDENITIKKLSVYEATRNKYYGVNVLPCSPVHALRFHETCARKYVEKEHKCPVCEEKVELKEIYFPKRSWRAFLKKYPGFEAGACVNRVRLRFRNKEKMRESKNLVASLHVKARVDADRSSMNGPVTSWNAPSLPLGLFLRAFWDFNDGEDAENDSV